MKTTLEIPDPIYRRIKARAALEGRSVKSIVNEAIMDKLEEGSHGSANTSGWRAVFGKAPKSSLNEVQEIIDEEFSRVDQEDWS